MKNLKISNKISILLALLLVFNTGVMVKLIVGMSKVNEQASAIATNLLPSIKVIGQINDQINSVRRFQLRYVLEGIGTKEGPVIEANIEKAKDIIEAKLKEYKELLTTPEEIGIFEELSTHWNDYYLMNEKFIEKAKTASVEEVSKFLLNDMKNSFDKLMGPAQKSITLNENEANEASQEGNRIYNAEEMSGIVAIVISVIFAIVTVVVLSRNIASPVKRLKEYMSVLQSGDYESQVPMVGRKDEIGQMAGSIQSFRESLIANREMEQLQQQETKRKLERQEAIDKLIQDFDKMSSSAVSSVAAAATELSQTAMDMSNTAKQTNEQTAGVAFATNQTSGTVQSVASAVEEMSASVKEISSRVASSSVIVREASAEAKEATNISNEMLEAARSIGNVAVIIDSIAGQINLLALNATIESARAGEAGKGFAVVASEVKNLAGQTTKATEDIRRQLEDMQRMADNVSGALLKLGGSVEKVDEVSSGIASAVEEQSAVTMEITKNMGVAATSVEKINSNIGSIQSATETTSAATQQILGASGMLSKQAEELNVQVRAFLDAIRAA